MLRADNQHSLLLIRPYRHTLHTESEREHKANTEQNGDIQVTRTVRGGGGINRSASGPETEKRIVMFDVTKSGFGAMVNNNNCCVLCMLIVPKFEGKNTAFGDVIVSRAL